MPESSSSAGNREVQGREFLNKATEATIRIALVALLAAWCFQIVRPFIMPVVWAIIIATAVFPAYRRLGRMLGGRERLAAVVLVLIGLLLLIVPSVLSAGSLVENARWLSEGLSEGELEVPLPPESIASWPLIGEKLHAFWTLAHVNLMRAFEELLPHLRPLAGGFLSAIAGVGWGLVQFVISIIIAGVFLVGSRRGKEVASAVATRLVDERGPEFVALAGATIRGVAQGILGVALIQTVLVAIGLFAAGVPHASLWTALCLVIAVVQLPPLLLLLPIIFYMFATSGTTTAVLFAIWSVLASGSDTFLKPILLARGLDLPMVVIFMGAIGGFMLSGFIGLFVGAVVLALGYKLFMAWLGGPDATAADGA
ncbi:MAG: AI-2E family transporter [Deltaproteobacteria bacterium]|jgi:predicted PurR-regulated permease PerM|nr:AI-2E family transporter [Deltaproteobacteria bacterium]MBW2543003.1 AI-2E family transporter [Deltaproteobacteria bacterium]